MKKILNLVLVIFVFILQVSFAVLAVEEPPNTKWANPGQIKTYIPPNHRLTLTMKHAFAEWTRKTNNKIVFRYVTVPENADIIVNFVKTIPNADREIGLTRAKANSENKMEYAEISIANETASGKILGKDAVYTVMLHEIGHVMGIMKHSNDPKSIMYPYEDDVQEILNSDINTLYKIYGWK